MLGMFSVLSNGGGGGGGGMGKGMGKGIWKGVFLLHVGLKEN